MSTTPTTTSSSPSTTKYSATHPQSPPSSNSPQLKANSLICKATFVYSKQECPRVIENRIRALHLQLSQQARGESEKRGDLPLSVVTIVRPIHNDCEPSPSVAGSSTSTLSSFGSNINQKPLPGLHRTQSVMHLESMDNDTTLRKRPNPLQGDSIGIEEQGWGYFDDSEDNSLEPPRTIYQRLVAYFIGSSCG